MANFTLKKKLDFEFTLEEEPEVIYKIPTVSKLSFEEAQLMAKFGDETTIVKQGKMIRDFVLKYAPGLEEKGLGDMEYYAIFAAYIKFAQDDQDSGMGESSASRNS